jgi:acetyl esterase/lipase
MIRLVLFWVAFITVARAANINIENDVVYGRPNGKPMRLDIYHPIRFTEKPQPAVLLVHGGGWIYGDKWQMRHTAEMTATAGFVAFSINYRLVSGPNTRWPAQLDDVQRAVRWVRAHAVQYGVDPDRIGAIGESAGGHLVTFLGTSDTRDNSDPALSQYSSRVQCVVDMYGPQVLVGDDGWKSPDDRKTQAYSLIAQLIGGKPEENVEALREASPLWRVDAKSSPFLIFHGGRDHRVPQRHSETLDAHLRKAGVESTLIIFPDEGHGFGKKEDIDRFDVETVRFLKQHLNP